MAPKKRKMCCNPYNEAKHSQTSIVRKFPESYRHKFENVAEDAFVCNTCRLKIMTEKAQGSESSSLEFSSQSQEYEDSLRKINDLNIILNALGEKKLNADEIRSQKSLVDKVESAQNNIKRKFEEIGGMNISTSTDMNAVAFDEIMSTFVEKFNAEETSRDDKFRILSSLPSTLGTAKITQQFGCSKYMVNMARKLQKEKGILSIPRVLTGHPLSKETIDLIKNYYRDDENSRQLPRMKDYVIMRNNEGENVKIQKRLVYCNLKELFQSFKLEYPDCRIGFSKFAELRPKECILAGASGTHTVCVCLIHQNVKLMIEGANLEKLTENWENPIRGNKSYEKLFSYLTCPSPNDECYGSQCVSCPDKKTLEDKLIVTFNDNAVESISYKQWIATDRCSLKTLNDDTEEFIPSLVQQLSKLLHHDFIAKQQSHYFKISKKNLKTGDFVVTQDFSENFAFIVQEAVQGFHWNNNQATLHPFVIYYKDNESDTIKHISYVGISDCLKHDTVAVYMFQKQMIEYLKSKFEVVTSIKYFSDGAPQQYKNKKNFMNLLNHSKDFGVAAEWNFFATAHGKGACDGVGGTLKRLARRFCLQSGTRNEIVTARELYEWAREHVRNFSVFFCSTAEYETAAEFLRPRFAKCKTIQGTLSTHFVSSIQDDTLEVKSYSNCSTSRIIKF